MYIPSFSNIFLISSGFAFSNNSLAFGESPLKVGPNFFILNEGFVTVTVFGSSYSLNTDKSSLLCAIWDFKSKSVLSAIPIISTHPNWSVFTSASQQSIA